MKQAQQDNPKGVMTPAAKTKTNPKKSIDERIQERLVKNPHLAELFAELLRQT